VSDAAPDDPAPVPPRPPGADDCCGGGCARCVHDVYQDALDRYRTDLAAWQARRPEAPSSAPIAGADRRDPNM
jgi:hypothetical protein